MRILAIETSCDETAAAVVEDGTKVLSNVVASSTAMHEKYGGIVPEVAAREQLKVIIPVINEAIDASKSSMESMDALAVTIGPGLIGSLLIGVETAKTIAFVTKKPIIPVNHVLAHMYANFLESSQEIPSREQPSDHFVDKPSIVFPAISLVVSGGHTELFLMESEKKLTWLSGTLDDAAGEAFDKSARLLGFGNGGGVAIQEAAREFKMKNSEFKIKLPRPLMYDDTLSFSFSGLKTAVMREWGKYANSPVIPAKAGIHQPYTIPNHGSLVKPGMTISQDLVNSFAHEIQEAITDVLVTKTLKAAETHQAQSILISGGVAANLRLREKFMIHSSSFMIKIPPVSLCTDNAVYIASYAFFRGTPTDWHDITALPDLSVETNL